MECAVSEEMPDLAFNADRVLGELEAAIMHIVWPRGEVTVRDVQQALQPERALAYTTVMTVMSRLAQKGVLATRKQGKTFLYHALLRPDELVAQRAQQAVQKVLAHFGDVAVFYFLRELDDIAPERLAELRKLAEKERDQEQPDAS
jgi:predicted transcriptional regulator